MTRTSSKLCSYHNYEMIRRISRGVFVIRALNINGEQCDTATVFANLIPDEEIIETTLFPLSLSQSAFRCGQSFC